MMASAVAVIDTSMLRFADRPPVVTSGARSPEL
jgi:hypothetical protein